MIAWYVTLNRDYRLEFDGLWNICGRCFSFAFSFGRRNCITRFFCARTSHIATLQRMTDNAKEFCAFTHCVCQKYMRDVRNALDSVCVVGVVAGFCHLITSRAHFVLLCVCKTTGRLQIYCVEFIAREFYALPWHAVRLRHKFRVLDHFSASSLSPRARTLASWFIPSVRCFLVRHVAELCSYLKRLISRSRQSS